MACTPPFCEGTGGCGSCNCKCCPPDPCYTSWTYKYYCGTSESDWDTNLVPSNSGCVCPSPALPFVAPSLGIEFPDFNYEEFNKGFTFNLDADELESPEVYALLIAGCSIPCATITIKIETTGCCLYKTGTSDTSFKAVGAGTISATITGGASGSTHGRSCDEDFQVTINGTPDSASVADCEAVTIAITPPTTITCCSCCKFESSGTQLSGGPALFRRQTTGDSRSKLLLNPAALKNALIQKMLKKR